MIKGFENYSSNRDGYSEQNRTIKANNINCLNELNILSMKILIQKDLSSKLRGFNIELNNKLIPRLLKKDNRLTNSKITNFGFILYIRLYCDIFQQDGIFYDKVEFKIDNFTIEELIETNLFFKNIKGIEIITVVDLFKPNNEMMKEKIIFELKNQSTSINDNLINDILTESIIVIDKYIFAHIDKYITDFKDYPHIIIDSDPIDIFNMIKDDYLDFGTPKSLFKYI